MIRLSSDLSLPLEIATESTAILARKGAGKSYLARLMTEQLLKAKLQVVIVDPKGDWHGIRSSADGNGPGFPIVILGGEHGDIPLEPTAGELTAKFIIENRLNVLIDLSDFRKHEVATFMAFFLETLYRIKAKEQYRTPMTLIVDEADAIAPQNPKGNRQSGVFDNSARMLGAAEDIVRRGRQRGMGIVLVTQRAAVLNKNVLTQTSVLMLLCTTGSQDIDAVDAWIKKHGQPKERAEVMDSIASLQRGQAWIWAPGWPDENGIFKRIQVGTITTFDSGATPKIGERKASPKKVAEVDLELFRKMMAETIEKSKADDPKLLRKEIVELKKQLARNVTTPTQVKVVDEAAIEKAVDEATRPLVVRINKYEYLLKEIAGMAARMKELAESQISEQNIYPEIITGEISIGRSRRMLDKLAVKKSRIVDTMDTLVKIACLPKENTAKIIGICDQTVTKPQQRILDAIAWWESVGIISPDKMQVGFIAGYMPKSGNYNNLMGVLKSGGFIEYPIPGRVSLTSAGRQCAELPDGCKTISAFHQRVIDKLTTPQTKLVSVLLARHPDAVTTEELAQESGYQAGSGNFNNLRGQLKSIGLIEYPFPGASMAATWLFPKGLK